MAINYTADEIFEMACRIERNGARFYRKAAQAESEEQAAQTMLALAEMEDEHLERFERMREACADPNAGALDFDPMGEAGRYLRAIADGHIFDVKSDPSAMLTGRESPAEILRMAIGSEKESIVFYTGLRAMVPDGPDTDHVNEIIEQELGHLALLSDRIEALS